MIILPYYEFGLYLTFKKKEWELHVTIPNQFKGMLAQYVVTITGSWQDAPPELYAHLLYQLCVLSDCPTCMQHKATNFEFIYFLEEVNFLKVTSLKTVIVLIFLFSLFNSMKLLIIYLQRTYFLYCLLKNQKK